MRPPKASSADGKQEVARALADHPPPPHTLPGGIVGNVVPGVREELRRRGGGVKQGGNMMNKSSTTKTGSHYLIDRKLTPQVSYMQEVDSQDLMDRKLAQC